MDKLLQAIKDYQREVMANFAHDDRQSYWRGKLNEAVHEADGTTPAAPAATGHTPTPEEIAAADAAGAGKVEDPA